MNNEEEQNTSPEAPATAQGEIPFSNDEGGSPAVMSFDPSDDSPPPPDPEKPEPEQGNRQDGQQPRGGNPNQHQRRKKNRQHNQSRQQNQNRQQNQKKNRSGRNDRKRNKSQAFFARYQNQDSDPVFQAALKWEAITDTEALETLAVGVVAESQPPINLDRLYELTLEELIEEAQKNELAIKASQSRTQIIKSLLDHHFTTHCPLFATGILETLENGHGLLVYQKDSYRQRSLNIFVPKALIEKYGLQHGHEIFCQAHGALPEDTTPVALRILKVMDMEPEEIAALPAFTDLIPYYPLERILLETRPDVEWDNLSMCIVDLITPVGFGQRGLIVAPPRTGKTILMQGMARAIQVNYPNTHLIILLVDERPEEVTDFQRQVTGEVIASTFDEPAESHVHAAEMVIEKSRRMVEAGRDVIILLDSITRLARAYNTVVPSSGKILTGGVEANALQLPKRFFGSARNIEDGGSLTILGTALVETGSKMDEVIFEEFKGTGNQELHLDRGLVDRRIFPAINMEKSGTRKEELLYHPDEMHKIHMLRRGMKGQPTLDAMETLITRVKKTNTNAEFLMSISQ
jgi:transcription termination factor Rho